MKRALRMLAYVLGMASICYLMFMVFWIQVFGYFFIFGPLIEGWFEIVLFTIGFILLAVLLFDEARDYAYHR